MAAMLAKLDQSGVSSKNEQTRDRLLKLDANAKLMMEKVSTLRHKLADSKGLVAQHEQTINDLHYENENLTRKKDELEIRLITLELEHGQHFFFSKKKIHMSENLNLLR